MLTINAVGNTANARTFVNEDGTKTVMFSLAIDTRKNGEKGAPIWLSMRASNGLAETLDEYLVKPGKSRRLSVCAVATGIDTFEVERTMKLEGKTVKFKDARQEVRYRVLTFQFLDSLEKGDQATVEAEIVPDAELATPAEDAPIPF